MLEELKKPMSAEEFTKRLSAYQSIFSRIEIKGVDECWEWTGRKNNDGYGQLEFQGKKQRAHRLVWTLLFGELTGYLCVCHKCDNRPCANPNHLFIGTHSDNMADARRKNRTKNPPSMKGRMRNSKLSYEKAQEIRAIKGMSQRGIAKAYGVHHSLIGRILHGVCWNESDIPPPPQSASEGR